MSATVGLAFSGGGIRSAAFCSGVLRRLLQREVKIHNMSCVSGGGYTGTAYLDWKYRNGQKDDPKWHEEFFDHMRRRAGYFCNWQNPVIGFIDALFVTAMIALVSVIFPVIVWMSYACPLAYAVDFLVGDLLRAEPCNVEDPVSHICIERDPEAAKRTILFASLLVASVLSFMVANLISWGKQLFQFISVTALVVLCLGFFPWSIHAMLENAPPPIQLLVLILAAVIWFGFPVLRQQAAIVMIVYAYSFVIHFRVYKHFLTGTEYSDFKFNVMVWVSGLVLWIVPFLGSIQQRLMHVFNRWRLQKAFYTSESVGATGCSGIGCYDVILSYPRFDAETKILTMADLENMSPFYICNTTANGWKRTPADHQSFEILTITPREIRRLDSPYEEDVFMDKLEPEDIRLSEAMAMSAGALTPRMGRVGGAGKDFSTDIKIILGVAMGASILSNPRKQRRQNWCHQFIPFVLETIHVFPLIAFPIVAYLEEDEKWITYGVFSYLGVLVLLTAMAILPTGAEKPGLLEKITRWFLINIPYIRYIRNLTGISNVGPAPPTILRISDGGHVENLGLLPLLQRRLPKIVVVNGVRIDSDAEYGVELLYALQMAREKLRCSFIGMDGRDVLEDVRANFVEKKPGEQPRSYKFKVMYYSLDGDDGIEKIVGEGQILFIAARHPNKGVQTKERVTWKDALSDINIDLEAGKWGTGPDLDADEVDRLTFCCCECCHSLHFRLVSDWCCHSFPDHSTANQYFTPAMFSAYHREGYRASMEAQAAEFLAD